MFFLFATVLVTLIFFAIDTFSPYLERFTGDNIKETISELQTFEEKVLQQLKFKRNQILEAEKQIRAMVKFNKKLMHQILQDCEELPSWFDPVNRYLKKRNAWLKKNFLTITRS